MHSELSLLEQFKLNKIWDFAGGIHPLEQKEMSNHSDASALPLFKQYFVPIKQHIGSIDDVIVAVGDQVSANQALTASNLTMTVPVHAPVSGKVVAIAPHVSAHPSAKPELTIIIESDDVQSQLPPQPVENWQSQDKLALIDKLKSMGISGMGGAGFPTHIKMHPKQPIEVLILNGVECEPYITADDTLMRYHSNAIVEGGQILQHILQSKLCVIAIEDNKPEAIKAMELAVKDQPNIQVKVIPTKYPSGGEKQLIQILTGKQVPSGGIPADLGIVMQNVGTAFAVKEAIIDGIPLTQRLVTLTGQAVTKPQNVWAKIGTQIKDALAFAGYVEQKASRLIMGGPMMGFAILDTSMPIVKTTNCILAPQQDELIQQGDEQACIRCGLCADACPADLLPQQLQWFAKAKEHDKLKEYNLFDCIECGACAYVCPSQIPLVQYYRAGKAEIREAEQERVKSDKAKQRFEQRQARLEREKEERLAKHKASAEKRAKALEKDSSAKDKIAAALARAKAKKAEQPSSDKELAEGVNTETKTVESKDPAKDKVAAAIARAKAKKAAQAKPSATEPTTVQTSNEQSSSTQTPEQQDVSESKPAEAEVDPKKAQIAAAIARAKAKKAQKEQQNARQNETENESESPSSEPLTAEQIRKQKVAAAIAKAKAKKAKSDS